MTWFYVIRRDEKPNKQRLNILPYTGNLDRGDLLLYSKASVVRNRLLKFTAANSPCKFAANLQGSQEGQKLGANFSKFAPIGISVAAELSELSRVDKLDQPSFDELQLARLASSIVKAYVNLSSQ